MRRGVEIWKKVLVIQGRNNLTNSPSERQVGVYYLYTLAVSPSLGVADNTKDTTKPMGISLRSSSPFHTKDVF